jgi:thiamine biosynthesis lipoprotein
MSTHVEHVMGMVISIDVRAPTTIRTQRAIAAATEWFHFVDATFSTYKPESVVSRLARGELTLDNAPPMVQRIIRECDALKRETGGFFDAYASGALDPSGLVKGWCVDIASGLLDAAGIRDHAINAGGDIRVAGEPSRHEPWRVGIAHPFAADAVCAVVELRGDHRAVATSGTAERGLHVINPHTRQAATDLSSVTVIGPDLARADAFATAALAMGFDAPEWLDALDTYEALCVDSGGYLRATAGFPNVNPTTELAIA